MYVKQEIVFLKKKRKKKRYNQVNFVTLKQSSSYSLFPVFVLSQANHQYWNSHLPARKQTQLSFPQLTVLFLSNIITVYTLMSN